MVADPKKAIVLGVHSFLDNHVKVGIQYIAEGLAKAGWMVDYVSIFSSPLDLCGAQRRRRLRRVWAGRQDKSGVAIEPGLTEYAFRAPCPAHRHFLRYNWQERLFDILAPAWLSDRHYDVCIHDVTANVLFLDRIHARHTVLRLNDLPEGFGYALSGRVIHRITTYLRRGYYAQIWSAHEPLTRHALQLNSANKVFTIDNGVDDTFLEAYPARSRKSRTAVFIGSIEQWIDLELIEKTAAILKDWQFDMIGPLKRSWPIHRENVRWLAPVPRDRVMPVLSAYQVGLIPFIDISGRLAYVEKPLKFYEYVASGLGVASTDVGALTSGLGDWASFGHSPESFANAIQSEAIRAGKRSHSERLALIKPHAWSSVMKTILNNLKNMEISAQPQ